MSDLSSAQIGTLIAVSRQFSSGNDVLAVTRITPKQVECDATRFRKSDGLVIGSSSTWTIRYGCIASGAHILTARIACAQAGLKRLEVTSDNLEAIEELLKAAKC